VRAAVYCAGLLGPLLLVGSFANRRGLGLDAPWYLAELVAIGYVPVIATAVAAAWVASAGQLAALVAHRYAPYPSAAERPPRGPVREVVRRTVLAGRRARRRRQAAPETERRALDG
jgi:hypothetical protein